jgi:hypothetical protein
LRQAPEAALARFKTLVPRDRDPMPSSPAKAGDPVFQSVCVHHRRSGILVRPVKPGDDGVCGGDAVLKRA